MVTQNVSRTHEEKKVFSGVIRFETTLDPIKFLKQIQYQRLFLIYAPIYLSYHGYSFVLSGGR